MLRRDGPPDLRAAKFIILNAKLLVFNTEFLVYLDAQLKSLVLRTHAQKRAPELRRLFGKRNRKGVCVRVPLYAPLSEACRPACQVAAAPAACSGPPPARGTCATGRARALQNASCSIQNSSFLIHNSSFLCDCDTKFLVFHIQNTKFNLNILGFHLVFNIKNT